MYNRHSMTRSLAAVTLVALLSSLLPPVLIATASPSEQRTALTIGQNREILSDNVTTIPGRSLSTSRAPIMQSRAFVSPSTHSLPNSTKLYLPLVIADSASTRVAISATSGGTLRAPDGTVIEVPPSAFPEDGYLQYHPLAPTSVPANLRSTGQGFDLTAITIRGQAITQFSHLIKGKVAYNQTYHVSTVGITPSLYFFDETTQVWQSIGSRKDNSNQNLAFSIGRPGTFGVMQALANPSECVDADVGRVKPGDPDLDSTIKGILCDAFLRAGGKAKMGTAASDDKGFVHPWGPTVAQDFVNGELASPILIYYGGKAFYMDRHFVSAYVNAGGPGGFLGLPETDSDPKRKAPASYKDDHNDFSGRQIMSFEHGFVAYNGSNTEPEAHRDFPKIKKATWETFWTPTDPPSYDAQGNPEYTFKVRGTVNEADANPRSAEKPELRAGFWVRTPDRSIDKGPSSPLDVGTPFELTFPKPYTHTEQYQFYFFVWRPSDDNLSGYYPCNYGYAEPREAGWITTYMSDQPSSKIEYTVDCTGSGSTSPDGTDDAYPEINNVKTWSDEQGSLLVSAHVTDDIHVSRVTLQSPDGIVQNSEMTLYPSAGPDVYQGIIRNVPPNKKIHYMITATDSSGHSFTIDQDGISTRSSAYGSNCPGACYEGHPINTATGNETETSVDLALPGRGDTVIVIDRSWNSQDERDGPFGQGSSMTYSMTLDVVDNMLLQGTQVRYGDGRTANFQRPKEGADRYTSQSPGVFDYVTKDGNDYVLHQKDLTTYRFNASGRLTEIRDRNTVPIKLTYDAVGTIDAIEDAGGRKVDLTWCDGHITDIDAPEGKHLHYEYFGNLLMSFTDANSNLIEYSYDPDGRVIEVRRNKQLQTQQEYDDRGRVKWQIIGTNERRDFVYNDDTRTTTVTNVYGDATTYVYDPNYLIASVTDALKQTEFYRYDEQGNLREHTDRRGATWTYAYDEHGNLKQRTDPIDSCAATPYSSDVTTWGYNGHDQVITTTNALDHTSTYEYDAKDNLQRIIAPGNRITTMTYDQWGQVVSITDPLSRTTRFAYDAFGNLIETIDPAGGVTRSAYDLLGRELSRTDANHHTAFFRYDGNDNLTGTIDAKGRVTTLKYDGNDRLMQTVDRRNITHTYQYDLRNMTLLTEQRDPNGRPNSNGYDLMNRRNAAADPLGNTTLTRYDPLGRTSVVTDALGFATTYGYDPNGNLTTITDALTQKTGMAYDHLNRLHAVTDAAGHTTTFCYDAEDRLIRTEGPRPNQVTSYAYDELNRLIKVIDPLGSITQHQYDDADNLTATIDPLGNRTDYHYDSLDRLVSVARPVLTDQKRPTTSFAYDRVGNTVVITSPRGFATHFTYDENDNLATVTDPLSGHTSYIYDEEDNPVSVTDPNQHTTTTTYNTAGLPMRVEDGEHHIANLAYDPAFRLDRVVDPEGRPTVYEYDRAGRLVGATDPLGNATRYLRDKLGRVDSMADANGNVTQYDYDPVGHLQSVTDALQQTTAYSYDEAANLTTITDANTHVTSFGYNLRNQVISETNALSDTWRYAYDQAGRLARRVDALNRPITYEYDSNNRLLGMQYGAEQQPVSFKYDLDNNQTGMCDALGCTSNTFDPLGRLTATTDWLGRTVRHDYDPAGNLTGLIYPNGRKVGYRYDGNNQLQRLTDPRGDASEYERNKLRQVTRITHPNNIVASFDYDPAGRLTGIDHRRKGASQPQNAYAYAMDRVGNRTGVTETRSAFDGSNTLETLEHSYGYDQLNRLTNASTTSPDSDTTYRFDPVGNRTEKSGTVLTPDPGLPTLPVAPRPEQTAYGYNAANQLRNANGDTLDYDRNGNRNHEVEKLPDGRTRTTDYTYDREDRLVAVVTIVRNGTRNVSRMEAHYEYDGYGRRVRKTVAYPGLGVPTEETTFLYDGLDIIGTRVQAGDKTSESYFYLAPSPVTGLRRPVEVEQFGSGKRYWYQSDGLDSTVALTDESGKLTAPILYDEYGQPFAGTSDLARFTYTAQDYDVETGLLHFYARYYDTKRGVWLGEDRYRGEIGMPGTMHRYGYVNGNPTNSYDLYGYSIKSSIVNSMKQNWISKHKGQIEAAAKKYQISSALIAAILFQEGAGSPILGVKKTIAQAKKAWPISNEQCMFSDKSTNGENWWCVSIGPGQFKPITALGLDKAGYSDYYYDEDITVGDIMARLENDEQNIIYVAAYIKYIQDKYIYACLDKRSYIKAIYSIYNGNGPDLDARTDAILKSQERFEDIFREKSKSVIPTPDVFPATTPTPPIR